MTAPSATIQPELGQGIYSIPDAATILNMPVSKVRRWVNKYWELEFLRDDDPYTWGKQREKAFHFLTLIEIIAVDSFHEIGVSFPKIKLAHAKLTEILDTKYPFAHAELMTDGKRIFHKYLDESLLEVDEKQQFSFTQLVVPYCQKIDFQDKSQLAERFWPLGKDHEIVVDPHHSFGQPVIKGTNTTVETIYSMLNAGESPEFVASIYDLNLNAVEDVMLFMKRNAA